MNERKQLPTLAAGDTSLLLFLEESLRRDTKSYLSELMLLLLLTSSASVWLTEALEKKKKKKEKRKRN